MTLRFEDFQRLGLFEEILNTSEEGINVVDITGTLIYVNKISAEYAESTVESMIGRFIGDFYPLAVLLEVLQTGKKIMDKKIHYVGHQRYAVSAYPICDGSKLVGAYSIFRDIVEMEAMSNKIKYLELQIQLSNSNLKISDVIDTEGLLQPVFQKAKRCVGALGGPRHSIITGESGTGKTMLATLIYNYARDVGVVAKNAPFIEVNCAQFTNSDIAAVEIFGSEEGAYTGSRKRKGLFEQANGGILFLDEAHALESYQSILLTALESGKIHRIGGSSDIKVNVIVIAASTQELSKVLLPELYQRLAQYELHLPPLRERSRLEKESLFHYFVNQYRETVEKLHNIKYNIEFTEEAREAILTARYRRNVRQFRDVINLSIDNASPLIENLDDSGEVTTIVDAEHLPFDIEYEDKGAFLSETEEEGGISGISDEHLPKDRRTSEPISPEEEKIILRLYRQGLGPRRLSKIFWEQGRDIPYYKISYLLSKQR